jgi:hypothetical protein
MSRASAAADHGKRRTLDVKRAGDGCDGIAIRKNPPDGVGAFRRLAGHRAHGRDSHLLESLF